MERRRNSRSGRERRRKRKENGAERHQRNMRMPVNGETEDKQARKRNRRGGRGRERNREKDIRTTWNLRRHFILCGRDETVKYPL